MKKFYNLGTGLGHMIIPAPGQNQLSFYTYEIACCRRVEAAKHVTCDLYFYTGGKPEGVESGEQIVFSYCFVDFKV